MVSVGITKKREELPVATAKTRLFVNEVKLCTHPGIKEKLNNHDDN